MTLEEKQELIKSASTEEELEERMKLIQEDDEKEKVEEQEEVKEEIKEEVDNIVSEEEERSLTEPEKVEISNLVEMRGTKMEKEEKKFGVDSKEYRSAWAKKMLNYSDDKLTEDEKRALGDAVTTTATTFVEADASTQGINNGGLLIPTSVRTEILELIEKSSPFFRDIRKMQVNGNIDLPYLFEADDAEWYAELSDTKNEGIEFKQLQLTGWELAKDVVVTWKLEEMAIDSFIPFIVEEIANKMGRAICHNILYGNGSSKPTGALNGLTAVTTGTTPIDVLINTYMSLSEEARIGAKVYVSDAVRAAIVGYKDNSGNYPYLQGILGTDLFRIETEPYLQNNDILVGNPRYYILNEQTPIRVDRERQIKGRKTIFGGYAILDGKAKPGAFAKGQYVATSL